MYRSIDDFLKDWKNEEAFTIRIFELITTATKSEKIHENVRSLERLAWHLTQTLTEMGAKAGLFATDALDHAAIPATMEELIAAYKNNSELLARGVQLKWTSSSLTDLIPMYGDQWAKGKLLQIFILHQAHHRGQMTVIMRVLGLPVPGLYGPSKEEWLEMGLPAMD